MQTYAEALHIYLLMFNMLEYNLMPQQQDYNNGKMIFQDSALPISTHGVIHISNVIFLG
jgi:hypothetical protein